MSVIDLSLLPYPGIVGTFDFETILAEMLTDLQTRDPAFTALVESDPAYKILEVAAYRETLIRQRVNDGARACMLAYATGADLDNLGALFGVSRLVLDPGDPDAIPPVAPTYESDSDYRYRIQLSLNSLSTAGPAAAYEYHARRVADVKDVGITSPAPGEVLVTIMSRTGQGVPSAATLDAVRAILNDDDVRPLTDRVTVQAATVSTYTVTATLTMYPGPDPTIAQQAAIAAVNAYVDARHALGNDIIRSGLFAALHQPGVHSVALAAPAADLIVAPTAARFCTSVTVNIASATDE